MSGFRFVWTISLHRISRRDADQLPASDRQSAPLRLALLLAISILNDWPDNKLYHLSYPPTRRARLRELNISRLRHFLNGYGRQRRNPPNSDVLGVFIAL